MLPLWALMSLGGAGLGLVKSELYDKPAAKRQRKVEAEKARWSPWTGMMPQDVTEPDTLGAMLQGGMGLGMLGANISAAGAQQDLLDAQKNYLQAMTPAQQTAALSGSWDIPIAGANPQIPAGGMPLTAPVAVKPPMIPKIVAPPMVPATTAIGNTMTAPAPITVIPMQPPTAYSIPYSGGVSQRFR